MIFSVLAFWRILRPDGTTMPCTCMERREGCQAVRHAAQRGRQQQSVAKFRRDPLGLAKFLKRHGVLGSDAECQEFHEILRVHEGARRAAECWMAPRTAAGGPQSPQNVAQCQERRGATRSAAESRGAPRSAAERCVAGGRR